jgi:hypothetical protein
MRCTGCVDCSYRRRSGNASIDGVSVDAHGKGQRNECLVSDFIPSGDMIVNETITIIRSLMEMACAYIFTFCLSPPSSIPLRPSPPNAVLQSQTRG